MPLRNAYTLRKPVRKRVVTVKPKVAKPVVPKLFAVANDREWVQIRSSNEPPSKEVSTMTRVVEELSEGGIQPRIENGVVVGYRIVNPKKTKKKVTFELVHWEGGNTIAYVPFDTFRRYLSSRHGKLLSFKGCIELPPDLAENMTSKAWRKIHFPRAFVPEEVEVD